VNNFRDWGIPLGRRFRALKLWFVLRSYGAKKLRAMVAAHIALAEEFAGWVETEDGWELLAPVPLNTVCFRLRRNEWSEEECNERNKALMDRVNAGGRIYLTHTTLDGRFTLRMAIGQTQTRREHVVEAWDVLKAAAG